MAKETNQNLSLFTHFLGASSDAAGAALGRGHRDDILGGVPVRLLGVAADGSTDDTTALNAIESGTVLVNHPVLIEGAAYLPATVSLVFTGDGQIVMGASGSLLIEGAVRSERSGPIFYMADPVVAWDAQIKLRSAADLLLVSENLGGGVDPLWWADDRVDWTGGGITAGAKTLTVSGGAFDSEHIGQWVRIPGAGGKILRVVFDATPTGTLLKDNAVTFSGGATGIIDSYDSSTDAIVVRSVVGTVTAAETCSGGAVGTVDSVSTLAASADLYTSITAVGSATAATTNQAAAQTVSGKVVTVGIDYGMQMRKAIASCGKKAFLLCSAGTHYASSGVPMNQHSWPSNIVIEGASLIGTSIVLAGNHSEVFFQMGNGRECTIRHIRAFEEVNYRTWAVCQIGGTTCSVHSSWFANAKYGLIQTNGAGVRVRDLTIEACQDGYLLTRGDSVNSLVGLVPAGTGGIVDTLVDDLHVFLCTNLGCFIDREDLTVGAIRLFQISNSVFKQNTAGGLLVEDEHGGDFAKMVRIIDCGFYANGAYGLKSINNDIYVGRCNFDSNSTVGVLADACTITLVDPAYYLQTTATDTANGGSIA